jgi:DNA polymerase
MPSRRTRATLAAPQILLARPPEKLPTSSLATVRRKALHCHDCPLWEHATQTVFGQGPAHAQVMLVGEQPGAQEDLSGEPFVGPAGRVLDKALEEAGLQRGALYLTNTVKHFKYETRGKARLHKRASAAEQAACRQWLAAELLRVRPRIVVALGAMAAQALFGAPFRMTRQRGQWLPLSATAEGLSTWHPSYVLRARDEAARERAYAELVADLRMVVARLAA